MTVQSWNLMREVQYFKKVCSRENRFPFQMPTPDIVQTVHEHPVFGINRKIRFQKQLDDS